MLADDKFVRRMGCAADGEFWVSKVLSCLVNLEKDTKHVVRLGVKEEDARDNENRGSALQMIEKLKNVWRERKQRIISHLF